MILAIALLAGTLALPSLSQAGVLSQVDSENDNGNDIDGLITPLDLDNLDDSDLEDLNDEIPLEIPEAALPDTGEEAPGLGEALPLPDPGVGWRGEDSLNIEQLRARFSDLLHIEANGDFQFFYSTGPDGASLRMLPVPDSVSPDTFEPHYLDLAWRLGDEWLLPLPAGQRVDVEIGARLYSPPWGATVSIRELIDGEWQSSSVIMEDIQWATYALAREISEDAEEVQIALRWQPELAGTWVEFRLPHIVIGRPDIVAAELSPTDTPTPTPEPIVEPEPAVEAEPTPTPEPEEVVEEVVLLDTPTPELIVVTSTPTPVDVFEEATRVALATAWAPVLGTSTPTPENMVTPTHTPTPFVIIVTNTPIPENAATAVYQERLATAIAFTTGTPTPYPEEAEVLLATNTPVTPPQPTNTPTPLFALLDDLPPTNTPQPTPEFPTQLMGKIMFLSDFNTTPNRPNVLIMNPDGSELGIMGTRAYYNRAVARDAYSADGRFHVYVQREGVSADGRFLQIKFDDYHYDAYANPMSFFANGHSWSPVWSPTRQSVAFVSNDTDNDEIYLVNINEWPGIQLTKNDWEWDHHPSFSPDGAQIVFSSNRVTGTRQIWMMDASGGNQRQITNFPFEAWNPVWVKYPDS